MATQFTDTKHVQNFEIHHEGKFKYVEAGIGRPLVLVHGLFGALSNFSHIINSFASQYRVVVPLLPIYDLPLAELGLLGLVQYLEEFIQYKQYPPVVLLGNSLGGHISLLYTIQSPEKVAALVLTGSSGLFENSMGDSFPRRGDYEFIKKKVEYTFYNPNTASPELIDEVFDIVNDREKALRVVLVAKTAIRHNVREHLCNIKTPTCLIWGVQDNITPAFVADEFQANLSNAELHLLDQTGHAPMMEQPEPFNRLLADFLHRTFSPPSR